jgi:outer membrane protein assembly factor BamA
LIFDELAPEVRMAARLATVVTAITLLLSPHGATGADVENQAASETKPRGPNLAIVPGPFYNPNLGVGVTLIPMLMFHPDKNDTVSPPSLVLLNMIYAAKPPLESAGARQSFFVSAASRLYLDEDRWRIVPTVAYFNLFQQFYGVGGNADTSDALFHFRLEETAAFLQVFRQVGWKGFYLGALLGYVAFHTKTDDPANQAILESLGSGSAWRGQPNFGVLAQYDSRNNKYYPSTGVNFNLRVNGSAQSGEEYLVIAPGFNQYFPLQGERLILAYRIFGQFGFGSTLPIAAYAHYGIRGTTLGYESGEFIDKKMAGAESEIRWLVWKRVGLEGGVGIGKVFADFGDFGGEPWLPGVWGSGTYKIMEAQDLRARMTFAYGKSGLLFYFTIGQTF